MATKNPHCFPFLAYLKSPFIENIGHIGQIGLNLNKYRTFFSKYRTIGESRGGGAVS